MAYLIDPETKTITEIEFSGDLNHGYKLMDCDLIEFVYLPHGNMLLVDEEGLLKPNRMFDIQGALRAIAGKAIMVGTHPESLSKPPTVTLAEAQTMVHWPALFIN